MYNMDMDPVRDVFVLFLAKSTCLDKVVFIKNN